MSHYLLTLGLIIDQFGAIRDEREQTIQDLKDRCFICNIDREDFDKLPSGFLHHVQHEHNISDYIGFLFLLKNTDLSDLTSVQVPLSKNDSNCCRNIVCEDQLLVALVR